MEPPIIPAYNKPDAPGIWMSFDNTVSVYHIVEAGHDFERASQDLFALLKQANEKFPAWPRVLYLEIQDHLDHLGRFDPDMVELQQEFLIQALGEFWTALDMPLVSVVNPKPQNNAVPDSLAVRPPEQRYGG